MATALLEGGRHDGKIMAVTPDLDVVWVGPIASAWVAENDLAPGSGAGQDILAYRYSHDRDDGTRVYVLDAGQPGRAG